MIVCPECTFWPMPVSSLILHGRQRYQTRLAHPADNTARCIPSAAHWAMDTGLRQPLTATAAEAVLPVVSPAAIWTVDHDFLSKIAVWTVLGQKDPQPRNDGAKRNPQQQATHSSHSRDHDKPIP